MAEGREPTLESRGPQNIDQYLNDPQFLSFFEKHQDATERAGDDEYLREKIGVFNSLKASKESLKKLVGGEAGTSYTEAINSDFLKSLEQYAADQPENFIDFSEKVSTYLNLSEKSKSLKAENEQTSHELDVKTEELEKLVQDRKLSSYIPLMKSWRKYRETAKALNEKITGLRKASGVGAQELEGVYASVAQLRSELKDADAFNLIGKAVAEVITNRIATAIQKNDHGTLAKERDALLKRQGYESILGTDGADELMDRLREHAKSSIESGSDTLVEKKEAVKLTVYEKAVADMHKKGIELGLSDEDSYRQIKVAFERKAEELKTSTEPQARIKLILVRRVISKLGV